MSRVVKRSTRQAVKAGQSRRDASLPQFVRPQLSQPVEKPPSGPQWVHEIKLDGYRMAARVDNGRVQLLTRTGLDWTGKYPSAIAALTNLNVKTAYIDGELCGVDDAGLPSFARTQAATDGERDVHLVYYAFDLLHLGGWDISGLALIERKALLEPLVANKPGLQYNGHDAGDGELILKHAGKLGFEGVVYKMRRAICPGKPWPVAQGQSAKPPGVRCRRLVGPGGVEAASWGVAARLLCQRRQAHLRRPRGHGDARQGACRSAATPRPAGSQNIASQRSATAQHAVRIAARSFSCSLGRAEARRRDYLFDLDGRRPAATHGLRRAAGG